MRVVVVGTGVMGLAAARVLAERGHDVVALDRFGVGNRYASSPGATRIWRLAHTDRFMVRLAKRTVAAWRDLERRSARPLLLQVGLLWRGAAAHGVASALAAENVEHLWADERDLARLFPELLRDDRPVVWQPEAGAVLAADGLAVQARLLADAGGRLVEGVRVDDVASRPGGGVRVTASTDRYDADVAVIAAGPWASSLLQRLGVDVALSPVLEQIAYVPGPPGWESRPAVIDDVTLRGMGGYYAMPTPRIGYKIGVEKVARAWTADDLDRSPDPSIEADAAALVRSTFTGFGPDVLYSEMCSWTNGPDDHFVLDRIGDVVVGTSDGGQAFKFSPLIGEILADLAEGKPVDDDVARFSLARFG